MLLAGACVRAQDRSRVFQLSPPDEKLLAEANELDRQFEKKGLIYHDASAETFLAGIGNRLLAGETPPDLVSYKFCILRDPMVNAFALPNGSIYINTGLIAALQDEAELAAVMSHEITHVLNRHTYILNRDVRRKAVTMDVISVAAAAASYFPGGVVYGYSLWFGADFSQALMIATVYGYSRELEAEGDAAGYARLIHAGYDGVAMVQAFQALDERIEFEPVEPFWRTHPKLQQRIATATKLSEAGNALHRRVTTTNEYFNHLAAVVRYNIGLDLDSRRARTAVDRADRLLKWNPQNAIDRTLLADAYRSLGAKTSTPAGDEESKQGKAVARKQITKLTADEEQRVLLATPAGKAALEANQTEAEALYREAIAADPRLPDPHRGLGMLYQDEGKLADAAREYRNYLDLAPREAPDRLRIERRLEASLRVAPPAPERK